MPKLRKRPSPPSRWPLAGGAAAGRNSQDFFLVAFSSDFDDYFTRRDRFSEHYTHILHFRDLVKHDVFRVPSVVDRIWWNPAGMAYAVGHPEGIIEIDSNGCQEIAIKDLPGVFIAIWGTGDDHLFACGMFNTFVLYRRFGSWQQLTLPEGVGDRVLFDVVGFNEHDVYFVGAGGLMLHFDGRSLGLLEVPTTRSLLSIALLDDQYLCIGGSRGELLFGNQKGWRFVPTGTDAPLYALAHFKGNVCFPTPDGVWSFDGTGGPTLLVDLPSILVSGLGDAITVSGLDGSTWLFDGQNLTKLDTVL